MAIKTSVFKTWLNQQKGAKYNFLLRLLNENNAITDNTDLGSNLILMPQDLMDQIDSILQTQAETFVLRTMLDAISQALNVRMTISNNLIQELTAYFNQQAYRENKYEQKETHTRLDEKEVKRERKSNRHDNNNLSSSSSSSPFDKKEMKYNNRRERKSHVPSPSDNHIDELKLLKDIAQTTLSTKKEDSHKTIMLTLLNIERPQNTKGSNEKNPNLKSIKYGNDKKEFKSEEKKTIGQLIYDKDRLYAMNLQAQLIQDYQEELKMCEKDMEFAKQLDAKLNKRIR